MEVNKVFRIRGLKSLSFCYSYRLFLNSHFLLPVDKSYTIYALYTSWGLISALYVFIIFLISIPINHLNLVLDIFVICTDQYVLISQNIRSALIVLVPGAYLGK